MGGPAPPLGEDGRGWLASNALGEDHCAADDEWPGRAVEDGDIHNRSN